MGGRMFLVLSLLLSSLPQQPSQPNQIIGTWINQDPATMGITHILIEDRGGSVLARVWGACVPTDCDWGYNTPTFHQRLGDKRIRYGLCDGTAELRPVAE